jgi:hypothetical protein
MFPVARAGVARITFAREPRRPVQIGASVLCVIGRSEQRISTSGHFVCRSAVPSMRGGSPGSGVTCCLGAGVEPEGESSPLPADGP